MLRVYMKFWLAVWIAGFLSVSGVGAMTESHKIASPDGSIEISVEIKKRILYPVRCDEQEILASSPMALFVRGIEPLGERPRLKDIKKRSHNKNIVPVVREKRCVIKDHFNETEFYF